MYAIKAFMKTEKGQNDNFPPLVRVDKTLSICLCILLFTAFAHWNNV